MQKLSPPNNSVCVVSSVCLKMNICGAHLFLLFNQKKKAVESNRLLIESFGEHAPSIKICEIFFRQFKSGDINVTDKSAKTRNWRHY